MDRVLTNNHTLKSLREKRLQTEGNYLIVFSHLRWQFVTQRPQHIIHRLAQTDRILFVEESIGNEENEGQGSANIIQVNEHITVLQPRVSGKMFFPFLESLLETYTSELGFYKPILWFYSPAFVEMIHAIDHSLVVYDCMDELSAFKGASQQLIDQEKKLFQYADIVFTGGHSLYEAKRKLHPEVYCFPSSVDAQHFEKARRLKTLVPADIQNIPHPIVGFYGVIDERINVGLIKKIARALPEVSFVMIGPVVKIDPRTLPQAENIYYLGQKAYNLLPTYLKAMDVTMMPFALNASTKFISPTKTLEFMAAGKPIISTPIVDVKKSFRKEVMIANGATQFIQAIKNALAETTTQKRKREKLQRAVIRATSWDNTVMMMQKILAKKLGLPTETRQYAAKQSYLFQVTKG